MRTTRRVEARDRLLLNQAINQVRELPVDVVEQRFEGDGRAVGLDGIEVTLGTGIVD